MPSTRSGCCGRAWTLVGLLIITFTALAAGLPASDSRAEHWLGSHEQGSDKRQRIAIVNSFHFCYEVIFGLVFSLGLLKHDLEVFINPLHSQFGVEDLLRRFYSGPIRSYEDLPVAAEGFDTVVYADWYPVGTPRAGGDSKLQRLLSDGFKGQVWVTIHEPRWLLPTNMTASNWEDFPEPAQRLAGTLRHEQLRILTIAPHVAAAVQAKLGRIGINSPVHWYFPVFPAALTTNGSSASWQATSGRKGFILQGNNEANRRDVPGLFASLGQHPSVGTDARFELRLVGGRGLSGVDLPPGMEQRIIKYQGLPFLEYYKTMQDALGMLTAFPKGDFADRYYLEAASSSVATAISVGLPLIVQERFLAAYDFIPRDAVAVAGAEGDAGAMHALLAMSERQLQDKLMNVALVRETAVRRNMLLFSSILGGQ